MNNSNSMFARATPILFGALFLIGLVAPFAVYPTFLMKILCFGLFACAFNLLLGFAAPTIATGPCSGISPRVVTPSNDVCA